MAKQTLPVNFKDDILAPSMGGKRRYNLIQNDDGTYSLEDVTEYTQTGSDFGAGQINATNQAVNESCDKANVIETMDDIMANQASGMIAGAKAVAELNGELAPNIHDRISGVPQTGTSGRIYAQKNGKYIDIDIVLSGCAVGRTYEWYDIGYVDVSKLGVTSTEYAYGQAYYSGGGPAYGDEGGQTTIMCESQSSGRIQLLAQCSKTMSGDKYFVASIHVPIVS